MLLKFNHAKVRHQIHEQRRRDLADRLKIRSMARLFETPLQRQMRETLQYLRSQDWK